MKRATATKIRAWPVDSSRNAVPKGKKRLFGVLLTLMLICGGSAGVASAEPSAAAVADPMLFVTPDGARAASLDDLLLVPVGASGWQPESADEALAAAVARGNDPSLVKPNPFRKKSFDLFRSEHDLQIGDAEMKLKFRVRPKTTETMTIELKF